MTRTSSCAGGALDWASTSHLPASQRKPPTAPERFNPQRFNRKMIIISVRPSAADGRSDARRKKRKTTSSSVCNFHQLIIVLFRATEAELIPYTRGYRPARSSAVRPTGAGQGDSNARFCTFRRGPPTERWVLAGAGAQGQ